MVVYTFGFCVNGILACSCALIGLLLNMVTIFILNTKKDLYNLFNRLLLWLLWFDNCVLITWILSRLYIDFKIRPNVFIWMFPYFTFPFGSITQSASTFMIVALAHERYLAVRDPVKYNQSTVTSRSQFLRVMTYALPVVLFSIAYNIPFFLCFYIDEKPNDNGIQIGVTQLRKNPLFVQYYINWTRCFVSGVIPFCTLFYYNFRFYKIIQLNSDRKRRLQSPSQCAVRKTEDKERNMAIVMFGIVALFLICHR